MRDFEFYTPRLEQEPVEIHTSTIVEHKTLPLFVFIWLIANSILTLLAITHAL